jgi:holo-[acyl-carrier protein] synthase
VIGIGVDLVEVERMRTTMARTPTIVERIFTADERAYADQARDPAQRYAARFAAKEAALKVLGVGVGAVDWHEIEVVRASSGAPELRVTGRALELAVDAGIRVWKVSLTHTDTMAEAVVVGL